jgi:hypothetical protein
MRKKALVVLGIFAMSPLWLAATPARLAAG